MKKNILVVEDHPAIIELLQKALEILGYNSIVAEDGKKAVDMAVSYLPDLILMDIVLPKMDGVQAASEIRKNPKTQEIPILAATALARPGYWEKSLQGLCDGYIAKPFTYRELDAAIMKLLNNRNKNLIVGK